ncbi:MAG: hypothetical protein R3B70_11130 [Polyangiaceae bacterium]
MQDPVRAQNLAAVAPLIAGSPVKVRGVEASEVLAAVEVELATQGGALRVRLEPGVAGQPAFARSRSLSISHVGDGGGAFEGEIAALRAFSQHLAGRDRGGIVLREPPRQRGLPVVREGVLEASWSREVFDRNVGRLPAGRRRFRAR